MFLITLDIWMRQKEKVMGMITSAEVICVRKVLYVYTKYIYRRRINTKGKANVDCDALAHISLVLNHG